jgi:hypothetical protein
LLLASRWIELRPLLKTSSIIGLVAGGIGTWKTFSLVGLAIPTFVSTTPWASIIFLIVFLLLGGPLALVSSLCLFLLRLTDEQNDILGFLSSIGSVSILVVLPYFFLVSS